jgi:hypothetical protein
VQVGIILAFHLSTGGRFTFLMILYKTKSVHLTLYTSFLLKIIDSVSCPFGYGAMIRSSNSEEAFPATLSGEAQGQVP